MRYIDQTFLKRHINLNNNYWYYLFIYIFMLHRAHVNAADNFQIACFFFVLFFATVFENEVLCSEESKDVKEGDEEVEGIIVHAGRHER